MSVPSAIAHYRITSKLGEGGMGAVFRATGIKPVAPDGKRIITLVSARQRHGGSSVHVNMLLNFVDELKRRIP